VSAPSAIAVSLSSILVSSLVGLLVLYALRRRSITTVLTATVLVPVLTLAVGVLVVTAELPAGRADRLALPVAVAVAVSVVLAVAIAKVIMKASVGLRRAVELLGDGTDFDAPRAPTAELAALGAALDEVQQRLREARAREEELQRSLREMLVGIGHDLRTPLARLRSVVEALQEEGISEPAVLQSYLGVLDSQTARLGALIDDLVELARITSGQLHPEPAPLSVRDLLSTALADAQAQAGRRGVAVTGEAPDRLSVVGDVRFITRVLDNLVDNAIAETPAGGQVHVRAAERHDEVFIDIEDTCGGIAHEDLPRVFDAGFRGDASRRADGRGFGLGLAIARGLATASGAHLGVENVPGGCRFSLRFARAGGAAAGDRTVRAHRPLRGPYEPGHSA
jgi:signal transduction histidine kinase